MRGINIGTADKNNPDRAVRIVPSEDRESGMNHSKPKQFVIYSRKSRFTGKGESIENQILLCRQYIAAHYGEEAADGALIYEDEGFSGGNLDRPRFRKMMADSKNGNFAAIVVYRLDRISRNIGDFAMLIQDLGGRGIDFISIREQFDTSSPMGRAMMYIASVFSQLERETIAERIRDNMRELAKTGRWLGGVTPTGYASESVTDVTVDGKIKKACRLKTVPEEMGLVRMIFDGFTETGSLTAVEQALMEKRALTRQGNRFTRFAVRGILSNPVYMIADEAAYRYFSGRAELFTPESRFDGIHGIMAYNRTLQKPGKTHRINPMEEWIVAVGGHEGVIPGETWVKVQGMLEGNRSKNIRRSGSSPALLSGILYCGCCGERMRPKLTDRIRADGEVVYNYLCTGKERSRGQVCTIKNADGNGLDAMVLAEIGKLSTDIPTWQNRMARLRKTIVSDGMDDEAEILRERIAENREKIRNLTKSLGDVNGTAADRYIAEQIGEYHEAGEYLRERLEELEARRRESGEDGEFDRLRCLLAELGGALSCLTAEEKRSVIRTFAGKIVWDGERAHLYLIHHGEPNCEDSK